MSLKDIIKSIGEVVGTFEDATVNTDKVGVELDKKNSKVSLQYKKPKSERIPEANGKPIDIGECDIDEDEGEYIRKPNKHFYADIDDDIYDEEYEDDDEYEDYEELYRDEDF